MIQTTPNYIELPATDLAATKAFYASSFGWTFTDYGPTYAAASVSGFEVGLNADASTGTAQSADDQDPTGPMLLLETDDLVAVHAALGDDDAVIVTSPFDYPGGRRLHFRDPSGNVLGVYQPDPD